MKKYLIMLFAAAVCVFAVPRLFSTASAFVTKPSGVSEIELTLSESGALVKMSPEDYLVGCLFAQIPVDYPAEALKAQACAAYTYALKLLENGQKLSDSTSVCQGYFTEAAAREFYGDSYELYLPAVREAAQYGAHNIITFENRLIYSVYHSVSAGVTNRPQYVWDVDFSYLAPALSESDKTYSAFSAVNELTTEMMRVKLLNYDRELNMPVDYAQWFTDANVDENGYVLSISVGGRVLSGGDVWRILGLRSAAFSIRYNGTLFEITTLGYGHGCGLSQYGAAAMARAGKTAEEILKHYYTGVEVVVA